jgi:hypothetical protein
MYLISPFKSILFNPCDPRRLIGNIIGWSVSLLSLTSFFSALPALPIGTKLLPDSVLINPLADAEFFDRIN